MNRKSLHGSFTDDDDDDYDDQDWTIKAVTLVKKQENRDQESAKKELEYMGLDADRNIWWKIKFGTMMDKQ